MNYKNILEEQIKQLQELQSQNIEKGLTKDVHLISLAILDLVKELRNITKHIKDTEEQEVVNFISSLKYLASKI